MLNTWFQGKKRRRVTFRHCGNEMEIDFMLIRKEHGQFLGNALAVHVEFHHAILLPDLDKKKIMECVEKDTY